MSKEILLHIHDLKCSGSSSVSKVPLHPDIQEEVDGGNVKVLPAKKYGWEDDDVFLTLTEKGKELLSNPAWHKQIQDGVSCSHPGCLNHVTHPCEGCGRIAGRSR